MEGCKLEEPIENDKKTYYYQFEGWFPKRHIE
jgi:hypothetical protein